MITINRPTIKIEGENAILANTLCIDGEEKELWFQTNKKYADYLCWERGDAYLIAVLNYAMVHHHDINIVDVPISEDLLFNIETYLIDALIENNPSYYRPNIKATSISEKLPNAGAVGTGISCGVDSLHSLANHHASEFKSHNITHLAFNNVGSHGTGQGARELFNKRVERPKRFAEEYGFEFVISDSNLMEVIPQDHFKTHTYSSMFPVFCLQKLYSIYFYASGGYRFNEFRLNQDGLICCGSYEMLSLPCFSNGNIKILSEGMGHTRMDKLKKVALYKPSYRYLNVCLLEGDNCNKCEKCVRTMLGLDAINALDHYSAVFDVAYYRPHKKWYLQQMLYQMAVGRHDYFEIYPYFKSEVTLDMRMKVIVRKIYRKIEPVILPLWIKFKNKNKR